VEQWGDHFEQKKESRSAEAASAFCRKDSGSRPDTGDFILSDGIL
jgi:hypothetical protein